MASVWNIKDRLSDNKSGKIFEQIWTNNLLQTIKSGGDLEEFIKQKDENCRQDYLLHDTVLVAAKEEKDKCAKDLSATQDNIKKFDRLDKDAREINEKIDLLVEAYPASKKEELRKTLSGYLSSGEFSKDNLKNLKENSGNVLDKVRNFSKVKKANKRLSEFVSYCGRNKVYEKIASTPEFSTETKLFMENSFLLNNPSKSFYKNNVTAISSSLKKDLDMQQYNLDGSEKKVQRLTDEYQSENHEASRNKENELIRNFAQEKGDYLRNPPQMTEQEVKQTGLSEAYIEGQVLASDYPKEARRSIRRYYEELKEPAAPVVGYISTKEVQSGIIGKMRAKGLDVVSSSDKRASDSSVFVVTETGVQAPFLNPKDALKANLIMIDAVTASGGSVFLSNPMTRESIVPAVEKQNSGDVLDLEKVAKNNPNSNYDEVISNFYDVYVDKNSYQRLDSMIGDIKNNESLKEKIIAGYRERVAGEKLDIEMRNAIARDLMIQNKTELLPYTKKKYQSEMIKEAYEKGIDSKQPNEANIVSMNSNKKLVSVFHGGQQGGKPFAVLSGTERMGFIYGASLCGTGEFTVDDKKLLPNGALSYAFGNSSFNVRQYTENGEGNYGFVYQYQSRGDKQEFVGIEGAYDYTDGKFDPKKPSGHGDETVVLPHQNKLEKIFIAVSGKNKELGEDGRKLLPLELDENGKIKDKRWRDFVEMHNPVDDNLKGNMIDRRNNLIADYEMKGPEHVAKKLFSVTNEEKVDIKAINQEQKSEKTSIGTVQISSKDSKEHLGDKDVKSDKKMRSIGRLIQKYRGLSIRPRPQKKSGKSFVLDKQNSEIVNKAILDKVKNTK